MLASLGMSLFFFFLLSLAWLHACVRCHEMLAYAFCHLPFFFGLVAEAMAELESLSRELCSLQCGDAYRLPGLGQAWFVMDSWDFSTHRGMSHNALLNLVGTEALHSFRFCSTLQCLNCSCSEKSCTLASYLSFSAPSLELACSA